jgi:uncharacterized protein (TIGR04551 family)
MLMQPSQAPAPVVVPAVDPGRDAQTLNAQGGQRPVGAGDVPADSSQTFSDDWWGHARPVLELHGYFRTRSELFHNFSLGRHNAPSDDQHLWPQPLDQTYTDSSGAAHNVALCGPNANQNCYDKSEASANMRFRLNPEIHISDNLRIMSQIDMLDNLVLGSTPDSAANQPSGMSATGYSQAGYNGYAPFGAFTTTQGPPTAGVNSLENSVNVKRVWGEYTTPLGQLRFGRMPSQWGLGMVANAGDGLDSDYQTTVDRIMFVSGIKSIDLYFGGAWDFVSTGPTSQTAYSIYGGQPYNTCNLCNVNEWVLFVAHRTDPKIQRGMLSHGDLVINGGLYTVYRAQDLDYTPGNNNLTTAYSTALNNGLQLRGARALIPDLWFQALWRKFRFEAELASIYGDIEQLPTYASVTSPIKVREYGLATQTEWLGIEDKLHLNFGFGWASGDQWQKSLNPGANGLQPELNTYGPISTFQFHPDYRVDLIFFRQILGRVEGAYYFRPSVDYDFLRDKNGQKFGGGGALIWSRASEFMQTPGNKRDLGVEMDLQVYYQSKDGSLNDDPSKMGGFYAMLQYGVFFPLAGLNYLAGQQNLMFTPDYSVGAAQTVRLVLGILF